jgi:hypothetical protein
VRVRLVNPFTAVISRLDTEGTENAGGYDADFGAVRTKTVAGTRIVERVEKHPVRVTCQLEDQTFKSLRMQDSGNTPEAKLGIVVEWYWLERNGHIDRRSGLPRFQVNDRLQEIYDVRGKLVHVVPQIAGGLYCVEVRPISYGIGRRLDLLLLRFNDRALGTNG